MAKRASSNLISIPEGESLVLVGPPNELTGRVALHNTGKQNVIVRNAGVKAISGKLNSLPASRTLPTVVLRPDQGRSIPLKIALNANTPPGDYEVELNVAGESRAAVLHVLEDFSVSIQPRKLVVANIAGQAQQKRVVIVNKGNVAFTVGEFGPVDLRDDLLWDRALRLAVEPLTNKRNANTEELIVAALRVAHEEAFIVDNMQVKNSTGAIEVTPGETATIDLEISLKEALPPNRRYRGLMPIMTQDLEILVVSSGNTIEKDSAKPEKQAASSTRKRTSTRSKRTDS